MANLDWSQCPAVESVPGKRSGAWVFRDTRTPVSVVFDNLEVGASIEEVMEWFHLSREQVVAVIEFAARSLDASPPSAAIRAGHRCSFSLITGRLHHCGLSLQSILNCWNGMCWGGA